MAKPPGAAGIHARTRQPSLELEVRREVARELHDRVAQTLTGMLIELENFKTEPVGWDDVLDQLNTIQDSTRHVLRNLRELLYDLRGEKVAGDGFVESVGNLVSSFEQLTQIQARLDVDPTWPRSLTRPATLNLHRIVEEALANVQRHSGARSVVVALQGDGSGSVSLQITDDGRGFDTGSGLIGMGTVGMKERTLILGGELRIRSQVGDGTNVMAVFPREYVAASSPKLVTQVATPIPQFEPAQEIPV